MGLFLEQKYIRLVSTRLRNFSAVGKNYNFSCPVCGDSKKDTSKTRGWFYYNDGGYAFKCYNCNAPYSFEGIVYLLDKELSKQFFFDRLLDDAGKRNVSIPIPVKKEEVIKVNELNLPRLSDLPDGHKAKNYILDRKVEKAFLEDMYYVEKFKTWVNNIKPTFDPEYMHLDHPRILLPMRTKEGKIFAISGRSINGETPKYQIIKFDPRYGKIFGMERLNPANHVNILEGQMDSLFIPNAVAVCGSGFNNEFCKAFKDNSTHIFDNEPRNPQIVKMIEKSIQDGYKVCIWPRNIRYKDVNDMVLKGNMSKEYVSKIIRENTFSGFDATIKFSEWRIS